MSDAAPEIADRPVPAPRWLLGRLWRGEIPLARAFWSYAVIGGSALNATATLAAMALLAADLPAALGALVFALPIPYNLLMLVAVWRSAARYQGRTLWADLARIAIIVWTALASAA